MLRRLTTRFTTRQEGQSALNAQSAPIQPFHEDGTLSERPPLPQNLDVNQLRTSQLEPREPILDNNILESTHNFSETHLIEQDLTYKVNDLKALQTKIPSYSGESPVELELTSSTKSSLFTSILPIIDVPLKYCIIFLHDRGRDETSLRDLARRLQKHLKNCFFTFLRGPQIFISKNGHSQGHCWNTLDGGDELLSSCGYLLDDVILRCLVSEGHFEPRNIAIIGHGQGAAVALRAAILWSEVEFGGVIAVGNSSAFGLNIENERRAKTPVLIVDVDRGLEERRLPATEILKNTFSFVKIRDRIEKEENPPNGLSRVAGEDEAYREINLYEEFLAHRLQREEWKKQDVISFDGGGIRGYGSLLILEALMEKIVDEEKFRDEKVAENQRAKSSFHPYGFKPTRVRTTDQKDSNRAFPPPGRADSANTEIDRFIDHPKESSRFLPCHYFTYAAGTSTGGLISIMIHRLRMPIDKCIEEYENLGQLVFGRPRPPILNIFSPKFDHKYLKEAINKVCERHGEGQDPQNWDELNYVSPLMEGEDMLCRCMVLAISYHNGNRRLYPFRTYDTIVPPEAKNKAATAILNMRGYGKASVLPVWKVARATSAAPGFFEHITIEKADGKKTQYVFKDGAFGHNNPSQEMYNDIVNIHGEKRLGVFVSIGTGETEHNFETQRNHIRDTLSNLYVATKLPTMTAPAHEQMKEYSKANSKFLYVRLDGGKDLGKIALDEWKSHKLKRANQDQRPGGKTLERIRAAVSIYLQQDSVQDELKKLAKCLVERRRLRIRDLSEWDRFASFTSYTCDIKGYENRRQCPNKFRTADDFREHIKKEHHVTRETDVEKAQSRCRHYDWVYH